MDVHSIPPGKDFRKYIAAEVEQCDVMVVVIGRNWAGEAGTSRRLDDARDFVRIELEAALSRDLAVIPVLIDRTPMPGPENLPDSLAPLAFRHAIEVDQGQDFDHHVDRLIKGIEAAAPGIGGSASRRDTVSRTKRPWPRRYRRRLPSRTLPAWQCIPGRQVQ